MKYFFYLLFFLSPLTAFAEEPLHQGWQGGVAGTVHTFYLDQNDDDDRNPPVGLGGGVNLWSGYRGTGRWEGRLNLNAAGVMAALWQSTDFSRLV